VFFKVQLTMFAVHYFLAEYEPVMTVSVYSELPSADFVAAFVSRALLVSTFLVGSSLLLFFQVTTDSVVAAT